MGSYQDHALESASAVELVVALYDGIIRFLYAASAAAERGDQAERRIAVKRALDIIIHLQARLRMDVGADRRRRSASFMRPSLRRFCRPRSRPLRGNFVHTIDCVRNVRDAWREVARDPEVNPAPAQVLAMPRRRDSGFDGDEFGVDAQVGSSWNA